jgi:hypothetical protein
VLLKDVAMFWAAVSIPWRSVVSEGSVERLLMLWKKALICWPMPVVSSGKRVCTWSMALT